LVLPEYIIAKICDHLNKILFIYNDLIDANLNKVALHIDHDQKKF